MKVGIIGSGNMALSLINGFRTEKKNKIIYEKIKRLENCRFKDFLKIYKKLPIIEANKALYKIINEQS